MESRHVLAAILLSAAGTANAVTIFSDNFNTDALALNATTFVGGWTVSAGTVDLIGPGLYDLMPGNGRYVDLDGSSGDAGVFDKLLALTGGVTYSASFQLAGSQRGDTNVVDVAFGTTLNTYTLASADPLGTFTLIFTPVTSGSFALTFANRGGDNVGALLDNVAVNTAIPEPSSYALMLAGLAGMGAIARRRDKR